MLVIQVAADGARAGTDQGALAGVRTHRSDQGTAGEEQRLVDARADVERAGMEVGICSSSGTGDYYVATTYDGITEVQARETTARYVSLGFVLEKRILLGDWATLLLGHRNARALFD